MTTKQHSFSQLQDLKALSPQRNPHKVNVLRYDALCTHNIPLPLTKKCNSEVFLAESSKHYSWWGGVTFQLDT